VRPFAGERLPQLYATIVTSEPKSFAELGVDAPTGIEPVVRRCLAKKPEDRFEDVGELALRLAPFGTELARHSAQRVASTLRHVARAGGGSSSSQARPPLAAQGPHGALDDTAMPPTERAGPALAPTQLAGPAGSDVAVTVPTTAAQARSEQRLTLPSWLRTPAPGAARLHRARAIVATAGAGLVVAGVAGVLAVLSEPEPRLVAGAVLSEAARVLGVEARPAASVTARPPPSVPTGATSGKPAASAVPAAPPVRVELRGAPTPAPPPRTPPASSSKPKRTKINWDDM
jgi:serine/threonine-protein kinase